MMHCKSYSHFFSKRFQHICVSLNVNFNDSLTTSLALNNWAQVVYFITTDTSLSNGEVYQEPPRPKINWSQIMKDREENERKKFAGI